MKKSGNRPEGSRSLLPSVSGNPAPGALLIRLLDGYLNTVSSRRGEKSRDGKRAYFIQLFSWIRRHKAKYVFREVRERWEKLIC
jgi:hypothetical protein